MHKKKAPHAHSGVASHASHAHSGSKYRGTGSNAVSASHKSSGGGGGGNLGPTKTSPTPLMESTKGVYANKGLHYANSTLLGSTMVVETVDGSKFEGIFTSWSPELEMVLEKCHKIEAHDAPAHINPKHVTQKLVFKPTAIVRSYCINVDLEFASKSGGESGFMTDTQITNANGEMNMRELEEWVPDADDDCDGLDLNSSSGKGWNAEEMFALNEQRHGVTTTYKDTLEGYTYQIKDSESLEFREREARADSIAREIQGNMASHRQVELENGDEEAMFSAVDRSQSKDRIKKDHSPQSARDQSGGQSKYVPPARRQNSLNKGSHAGGPMGGSGRHYQQGHMHSTPPPNQNSNQHHTGRDYHAHRDRDHHGHGGHDDFGRGGHGGGGPSPHQGNGSRQSYERRQQGNNNYSGSSNTPNSGSSSLVNNNNSSSSTSNAANNAPGHNNNSSSSNNNIREANAKTSPQSSGSANPSRLDNKENSKDTSNRGPHATAGVLRGPPPNFAPSPAASGKSQAEHVSELKDFHVNFKMAGQHNLPPPLPQAASSSQTSQPPPVNVPPAQTAAARTSSPMGVSASSGVNEQQNSQKDVPYASPNQGEGSGSVKGPALKPEPASNEGVEVAKKSTLNPNAKEFNFNPNAKAFVPSGPSGGRPSGATPPARPQTPGTPSGHQLVSIAPVAYPQNFAQTIMGQSPNFSLAGYNHGSSHAGTLYTSVPPTAVPANMAMPTHTVVPQPHQMHQHPQSQGQRFRGNNGPPPPRGSMGGEGPSPMHVSGQPLLATGLLGNIQAQGHQPPTSFMQFQHGNPAPMQFTAASLANQQQQQQQQIAHLRFTNAHGGMVPTSMAPFLTQPHTLNVAPPPGNGSQDGPQSLPQWQGGVPSSQQPNMPPSLPQGSMTPTPSQAGGGGGTTTPSPGPHHHPHHPHHHPLPHHHQQHHQQQQQHQHQQHHQMMFNIAAAPGGQPQSLPPHFMQSNIVMNYPVHPQMTQPHNMPPQQAMGVPVSGVAQHYMPQGIHNQQFMMAPNPGGPPPVNGVQPTQ
ncbi:ataxin-2 homolog [Tigriopus californicus]|uniref:ataxin-2 homolog n=1 Tax=Tigriopus californicus TaxID=6832 RepID=UPI0027DA7FB4|nr:ataxin-2 homolog [Tigriopus californicus]